ncbi:MAG: metallophosphoesterase family protein, partial [Candidatus Hadarchaeales archaeon]
NFRLLLEFLGENLKILVAADFHGAATAESNLSKFLERGYDCAILIGDLTEFGPPEVAESILSLVESFKIPVLSVPGNCDPKDILAILDRHGANLHGKCRKIGDVIFVGLGGSNITPFRTPFELTEAEILEELSALLEGVKGRWALVTHAPPFETKLDELPSGTHVGSKSVRQIVEEKQPLLLACGHIHEARAIDRIKNTIMVNPGPISKGFAAEVVITENDVHVELLQL